MSDGRFLFLYFPLFGIVLLATYDAEPEKGGGHTPPPALTRPALFALTLLNYDLTPLGLWPQSQLLVLDLIPPHANFMTFMYVVNKNWC